MTRAERALLALLVATAAFAPIFLGGVGRFERESVPAAPSLLDRFLMAHGPWSILTFLAFATAAAGLAVARERSDAGESAPWRLHPALLLPFAALAALAVLQWVPLPRWLLGLLSPRAARQAEFLLPGDGSWRPLTLSPEGTRDFLAGWFLGAAVLGGALLAARRPAAARVLLGTLVAVFALAGLYGMVETATGSNRVLGYRREAGAGVVGTFVNRSHMAAAAGIGLPLALALGFGAFRRRAWPALAGALAAAAVLALVVPLTHSRMGLAAGAAGLAAFGLLAARSVRWPPAAKVGVAAVALLAVAGGLKAAWDRVPAFQQRHRIARMQQGFFDVRFPAWISTVELASRYPVLGTGLGSYEVAIHETQSPANRDEIVHAHSEPLEFLSDGGVAGFALALLVALAAARGCLRLAAAEDPDLRILACGCGGAMAALLAGCTTEFHLRIPALGVAAAILAAVPAALAAGEPRPPAAAPGARRRSVLPLLVLAGAGVAVLQAIGASAGSAAVAAEKSGDAAAWRAAAERAVHRSGNAFAHRSLSGALLAGAWEGPDFPARAEEALRHADRAVDLEPFQAYSHWARVRALLALGRFPEAAEAVGRTTSRAGGIGHLLGACGTVLLELSAADSSLVEPALRALREAGNCDPHHWSAAEREFERRGLPSWYRAEAVPELWYPLESFLEDARKRGDAESERRLLRRIGEGK